MPKASIFVAAPGVVRLEEQKCALANSVVQVKGQVLVEVPVYDSGKEAWLTIAGAYVVFNAYSIYSRPHSFGTQVGWCSSAHTGLYLASK
ncbi:hypothetical protein CVT26_003158 [Gymnopilus dilepis]|uniref:Uncharacterized protein n=1 Tax=Gymnopilus dilepis TaxID=231916 RepID=A0A409X1D2_9AGAR|nr:hypothetical protein CVT26_003158 [Gymnopilus dilepis]